MHISFQRRLERDLPDVRFSVQDRLIEMRDRPAGRNMIIEQLRKLVPRLCRRIVAPCAERHQQLAVLIKNHIAVHHGGNPKSADRRKRHPVFGSYVGCKLRITILKPRTDIFKRVCPDTVVMAVFPLMTARCNGRVLFVHKDRLDPRGSEFDAECGMSALNACFRVILHNYPLTVLLLCTVLL